MTWTKRVSKHYEGRPRVSAWYESGEEPKPHYKLWLVIAVAVIIIVLYVRS